MSHTANGASALQLSCECTVAESISTIESLIRQQPGDASHRWTLFQWLCVARDWDRAIRQLQVFAQLDASSLPLVQACRDLVRAERWRERVMLGQEAPACVFDDVPPWMQAMITALKLTAQGELAAADNVRLQALDAAPLVPGRVGEVGFDWIADSDSRLGPVCEIMTAGSYRWLAFSDIAHWQIEQPAALIDLVWARCALTLDDGTVVRGFMPARYPSHPSFAVSGGERDALDLGRRTAWSEVGRTGVLGAGRKTWMTSVGDIGLFELDVCTFAHDAVSRPTRSEAPVALSDEGGEHGGA